MNQDEDRCALCRKGFTAAQMRPVPMLFVPGAHFLYGCARYAEKRMYIGSCKFFIGPIFADFEVRGAAPACPTCRRIGILCAVALYLLVVGAIAAALLGR